MDLHRTFTIPVDEWAGLEEEAIDAERLEKAEIAAGNKRAGKNDWNERRILLGKIGEWCYEQITGLPRNRGGLYDGGTDFPPGVDVKAVPYFKRPILMRPVWMPMKAPYYALCATDLDRHLVRYVGYCTREELENAPQEDFKTKHEIGLTRALRPGQEPKQLTTDDYPSPYLVENLTPDTLYYAERGRRLRLDVGLGAYTNTKP